MRFNKTAIKGIAATLVLGQLNMALQPLYAAVSQDKGASSPMVRSQIERMQALQRSIDEGKARKAQESLSPADQASQRLARVEELVRDIAFLGEQPQASANAKQQSQDQVRAIGPNLKARLKPLTAEQKAQRHDRRQQLMAELKGLLGQQAQDQAAVRAEFAQTRQTLQDRKLPAEILARHDQAVAKFEQRVAQFNQSANKAQQGDEQALAELQGFFDQNPTKRRPAPINPDSLPWRTPEPTKRLPAETQTAWFQNLYANKGTRLAQVGNSLEGLEFVTPPEPGVAPTAADLAETPETQRTAAIKAKALELGNNPVNIQNWVRNNVEWVPTWGAIQSAQDTLDKKRGNAIDIASLEIALLRAAKIPARYQFGTIELPAEQVMNWVGGVTKPEAAQQLLGQGGIANRGLIEGGRISKIRMEHAWVQAYVNWLPSRGAKQGSATQHPSPQSQRNAWVPLDPSFKQYQYGTGLDLRSDVRFDADNLFKRIQANSVVSDEEGWVQGMSQQSVLSEVSTYQARIKTRIESLGPQARMGDVLGRKDIVPMMAALLHPVAPYQVQNEGGRMADLPDALRHKFVYKLYASEFDRAEDVPLLQYQENLSRLVAKRLTLKYVPATQADADVIEAALPKPHADGSSISVDEIPKDLPGYLIRLKAQLLLDGQVVAEAVQPVSMGTELPSVGGFTALSDMRVFDFTNDDSNVAGQMTAIGISGGGVSGAMLARLQQDAQQIRAQLTGTVTDLNGESLSGTFLTSAMWSWFSAVQAHSRQTQSTAGVVEYEGLSYGLFHALAQPQYSWGVVRRVSFPGVNFDIGHVRAIGWDRHGARENWVSFNRARGQYMSSLEHAIPGKLFQNASLPAGDLSQLTGVSAVKALTAASAQGQKIYKLNASTAASLLRIQIDDAARQEIQQAIAQGKEVVVHERPVDIKGWRGSGYTVIDPETGAGGYLISGRTNGGVLAVATGALSALVDSLTQKLRNPNHVNGPLDELQRSYWLNKLGQATTLLAFVVTVSDIVTNDSLSVAQKVLQISATLAFTIAAMEGAAALGAFFMFPATGAIAAVALGIALAAALYWLNNEIATWDI